MSMPVRGTSESDLDQWNRAFRQSPIYLNFMRRNGLATGGRVRLSRSQQSALEAELAAAGSRVPSGMHIDQGGNLNQKNRLGKALAIGGGAAAAAFGIPGVFPGLLTGGGGAAGAGAAGVLPSTPLGGAYMGPAIGAGLTGSGATAGALSALASTPLGGAFMGAAPTVAGRMGGGLGPGGLAGLASGGGAASQLLGDDWQGNAIDAAIAALAGLPGVAGGGPSEDEQAIADQIEQLLGLQRSRMASQGPLFDAATRLAMSRLPRAARGEGS